MGRFEKYMGEAVEVELEFASGAKEKLMMKPLPYSQVNKLLLISKDFTGEDSLSKLTDESVERIKDVVLETMKMSYPDEPIDELKGFVAKNFMVMMPFIMDINFNTANSAKMDKLQAKLHAGQVQADKAGK